MAGDIDLRIPGDVDLPAKFFGQFTPADLVRIAIPTVILFGIAYPFDSLLDAGLLLTGLAIGLGCAFIQPKDRTIDQHVRTSFRYLTEGRTLAESIVAVPHQDHYRLEDDTVIGIIQVTPTNLALQSRSEQKVLHDIQQDLLNTISYPVELHSRQRQLSLDTYLDRLTRHDGSGDDGADDTRPQLRDAYTAYCQHFNDDELVTTDHYLVVRIEADGLRHATSTLKTGIQQVFDRLPLDVDPPFDLQAEATDDHALVELDRRLTELTQAVNGGKLTARRVSGPQLVTLAEQVRTPNPGCTGTWTVTPAANGGGEYRQTVMIDEYPSTVSLAWPADLLQVDGMVDVVQRIEPADPGAVAESLSRTVDRLEAEIMSQQAEGYGATNQYEARAADAHWMLDQLADREDAPVRYGCYITAHHSDEQQCRATMEYVETQLQTKQFEYSDVYLRTDQAFRSQSPLHGDGLHNLTVMPSSAAASGFPFATTDALGDSGVIYGTDTTEDTPIMVDRFGWDAAHTARMGRTGSGKSYATKLEIIRSLLAIPELRVFVIDPKQEYAALTTALGGSVSTITEDTYQLDADLTCFRVPDLADQNKATLLKGVLEDIYEVAAQDYRPTLVFIDEAHNVMATSEGRRVLETFVREARSTNTGITLISQNASDFTGSQAGRVILDNCPGKVFHYHERVDTSVKQYFGLSDREATELQNLETGSETPYSEAILKIGNAIDAKLKIHSTVPEHRVIAAGEPGTGTEQEPAPEAEPAAPPEVATDD